MTWKVPRWFGAEWVALNQRFRDTYGERAAEPVEMIAHCVKDRRDRPSAQDIKHTLLRIADRPAAADLRRIDGYTMAELSTVAMQQHGTLNVRTLTPLQLAECARLALRRSRRGSGTSPTDDLAVDLVRALLRIAPDLSPTERDAMLHDALVACRLGAGKKTIERLITKAGQVR